MTNSTLLLLFFLLIIATFIAFFPLHSALAESNCSELWDPDCSDGNLFNGYRWRNEGWVPGLILQRTHFTPAPTFIKGQAVYYAAGVMEATARYMGFDLSGYIDGVAMMSCGDIGQTVWIRRDGEQFEGPFLVVDCAEFDDHFPVTIFRGEVVEVGYRTAKRWGFLKDWTIPVEVLKSRYRPIEEAGVPADYGEWFLETVKFYSQGRTQLPARYIFRQPGEWYAEGRWISYLQFNSNPLYIESWIRDLIYRKDN